jgi:regulator of ribosome biosynthesis
MASDDHVYHDLKNMAAWTLAPLSAKEELTAMTTKTTESLVHALFQLPSQASEDAVSVILPQKEVEVCPREKPLPKEKPKTRWEKFAEEKGLKQQKRSRMVWDETIKDWAPRHGFKSVKKNAERVEWAIEAKPGDDPSEDPFLKRRMQKQLDQSKQKFREVRNTLEAAGQKVPTGVSGGDKPQKKGKAEVKEALRRSQQSTASHGRHDSLAAHESKAKVKTSSKVTPQSFNAEKAASLKLASKVLEGGPVNKAKAARVAQHDSDQRAAKRPKKR